MVVNERRERIEIAIQSLLRRLLTFSKACATAYLGIERSSEASTAFRVSPLLDKQKGALRNGDVARQAQDADRLRQAERLPAPALELVLALQLPAVVDLAEPRLGGLPRAHAMA